VTRSVRARTAKVRLSVEEHDALESAAQREGLSLAALLRRRALAAETQAAPAPTAPAAAVFAANDPQPWSPRSALAAAGLRPTR
jgi:hypothetical protein